MAENSAQLHKLRLFVNPSTGQVIYAEADKTFVDFFFSLLTMPMGAPFLRRKRRHRCGMHDKHLQERQEHGHQVSPTLFSKGRASASQTLRKRSNAPTNVPYYVCGSPMYYGYHSASNVESSRCDCEVQETVSLASSMKKNVVAVGTGYVKETVTFIVTDDLEVTPASTVFIIKLLNEHNIKDVSKLEQRWVDVGYTEAVKLLEAALLSKNALNDVFGGGRRIPKDIPKLASSHMI